VLWLTPGALETDTDGYRRLAENLVRAGERSALATCPRPYRPPLYPLLLTSCAGTRGAAARAAVAVLHLVMGLSTSGLVLVWDAGGDWETGARHWLRLLVACDSILLSQSTQVMTETPAALLATAGWCF